MRFPLVLLVLLFAQSSAWIVPQCFNHRTRAAALQVATWSTDAPLKLEGQPLVVDFSSSLGNGSYGSVHTGLWGKQAVVVKVAVDDDKHHGKKYLDVEEYVNRKLMKANALVPSTSSSYFAPYVGHVNHAGAKMLVWRRTGDGTTLRKVLDRGDLTETLMALGIGKSPSDCMHNLLGTLARIAASVHAAGICHRDIKPANLLIDTDARSLRLIDFGSAADMKAFLRQGYDYSQSPCSPFYCAPEEFLDESAPYAFDVYSIGVIWLRCVFPYLHEETAWEEFYHELKAANHDLDVWLQRKLLDDAMPDGMSQGLAFFQGDSGRGWRLLNQMLRPNPEARISLDFILSDPYVVGAGGTVSRRLDYSKSFFDTVMEESVDVCAVDEEPLSIKVTLPRPFGLGLEEKDTDVGGVVVDSIVPGGAAERSNLIAVGDSLCMVGDVHCETASFDEVMWHIKAHSAKKVPLLFQREAVSRLMPTNSALAAAAARNAVEPDAPRGTAVSMKACDAGVVSIQGKRASMEDAYCLSSFYVTPFGEEEPVQAYLGAVFDGHRGAHASTHAAANFSTLVKRSLSRRHRTSDATAIESAWTTLVQSYIQTGYSSGCTAAVALVIDGALHALNCGDSRVLLISPGHHHVDEKTQPSHIAPTSAAATAAAAATDATVVKPRTFGAVAFVTRDHTPYDAEEAERITAMGGQVVCKLGKTRVRADDWNLAISRSMGGVSWQKAGVIATSDVTSIQLHDAHEAVVIASDGVFEVLDSATVANLVHDWKREGVTASAAAKRLTDAATEQNSPDNISAIVMYLAA